MQRSQIHISQSLRGVQQFLDSHAEAVRVANTSEARKKLDVAVEEYDRATEEQATRIRESHGEVNLRAHLERTLVRRFMTPLAKFARAELPAGPELAALTRSSNGLRRERLVNAAQSMADAARPFSAAIVRANFPTGFLADFRAAADAVQRSLDARAGHAVARTGATKLIATAARDGRRAVAALDAIISYQILGDERLEREWRAAKRVRRAGAAGDAGSAVAAVDEAAAGTRVTVPAVPVPEEFRAAA